MLSLRNDCCNSITLQQEISLGSCFSLIATSELSTPRRECLDSKTFITALACSQAPALHPASLCRKCIPLPSVFPYSLHFSADSLTPRPTLKPSLRLRSYGSGSCVSLLLDYSLLPLRPKLPQPFPGPFHTLNPLVTFILDIQSTLLQLFKETRGAV